MESQRVDMYLMTNSKFYEPYQLDGIRNRLLELDDSKMVSLQAMNPKDPTLILIVSILAGALGIDRFLIGDTGLGIGKLLTCGGLGIWVIVDWFLIMPATKQKNIEDLQRLLY
jgi:TM2 domain-containing membrane protein YozV